MDGADSPLPSAAHVLGDKRKLDSFFGAAPAPAAKAATATAPPKALSAHTRDTLAALSRDELLDAAVALAARLRVLEAAKPPAPAAKAAAAASPEETLAHKARFCAQALRQIKAQMKWKPSCKTGGARFSFEGMLPPAVYQALIAAHLKPKERLPGGLKPSSSKRLSLDEFHTAFGADYSDLRAPIRYGSLGLTGEAVTLRYDAEAGELRITGSYGL